MSISRTGTRSASVGAVVASIEVVPFIHVSRGRPRTMLFVWAGFLRGLGRRRRWGRQLVHTGGELFLRSLGILIIFDGQVHRVADRQAHESFARICPPV